MRRRRRYGGPGRARMPSGGADSLVINCELMDTLSPPSLHFVFSPLSLRVCVCICACLLVCYA